MRLGAMIALVAIFPAFACVGTTGGAIVDFIAAAGGPPDAVQGQALTFTTDRGFHVSLTKAVLHIGALYLDQSEPVSGAQNTACILPGTYVAQETTGRDVDLLSPVPQEFPAYAHGTTTAAAVGQVWLTGGDVNTIEDSTPILVLEGTFDDGGPAMPFTGTITISTNRQATGELAGASPICKQRIVSPIPAPLTVGEGGTLVLRIDPRDLFTNVDMSQLTLSDGVYAFSDDPTSADYTQPSINLYDNLRSTGALYTFSWEN